MIYNKVCKECGKEFPTEKKNKDFCCRPCYRKNYSNRHREENFPMFRCSGCNGSIQLDFYPDKEIIKWEFFICPICGKKRTGI